jgi:hypothetical protein
MTSWATLHSHYPSPEMIHTVQSGGATVTTPITRVAHTKLHRRHCHSSSSGAAGALLQSMLQLLKLLLCTNVLGNPGPAALSPISSCSPTGRTPCCVPVYNDCRKLLLHAAVPIPGQSLLRLIDTCTLAPNNPGGCTVTAHSPAVPPELQIPTPPC